MGTVRTFLWGILGACVVLGPVQATETANSAPTAMDGFAAGNEDSEGVVLSFEGTDPDGDALTFRPVTEPANGAIESTADGYVYVPDADYFGIDEFRFVANDGQVDSEPAKFRVWLEAANDRPIAKDLYEETTVGVPTSFMLIGNDYTDGEAVQFNVTSAPASGNLTQQGQWVTYTPQPDFVGTVQLTYVASDGALDSDPATVEIVVRDKGLHEKNGPPEIVSAPVTEASVGLAYEYDVDAVDPDGDPLTYFVVQSPGGMAIDADSGVLSWVPGAAQIGTFQVVVGVYDTAGTSDIQIYDVTVTESGEHPPQITSTPVTEAVVGTAYAYDVNATDPDEGDTLTYSLLGGPEGLVIDATSGLVEWTPSADQTGTHPVQVQVTDSTGLTDSQSYSIDVAQPNRAPTAEDQQLSTTESIAVDVTLSGTDPDGDALDYTIVQPPEHGRLLGTAPGLTYAPDAYYEGADSFAFIVNDGEYDSAPATVTIDITGENNPPRIISEPVTPHVFERDLSDAEPQVLSDWELVEFPSGHGGSPNWSFSGDGLTATQTGNNPPSTLLGDFDAANRRIEGTWRVRGSDDDYIGFVIGYQQPGRHYLFGWKKNAQSRSDRGYALFRFDLDESEIQSGMDFAINNSTQAEQLYGNDRAWLRYETYRYSAVLTGGALRVVLHEGDELIDAFIVEDDRFQDGRFGIFNSSLSGADYTAAVTNASADNEYWYDVQAVDPDGDEVTYSLVEGPDGLFINERSGTLYWDTEVSDAGTYRVVVQATDEHGASTQQAYDLVVSNDAPLITSAPPTSATAGQAYSYPVATFDPNPDEILVHRLVTAPDAMSIDAASGVIQWTPTTADLGTHTVTVEVEDNAGLTDSQTYTLAVTEQVPNEDPYFTSQPPLTAVVGQQYHYAPQAADPDGDPLQFGLVGDLPYHMQIFDGQNITWIPGSDQVTDHTITVDVRDGNGGVAEQTFTVSVVDADGNRPPDIGSTPVDQAAAGQPYSYAVFASDPDGDAVTFELVDAPEGMAIDASTGAITWQPTADDVAFHDVRVRAIDAHGAFGSQAYRLAVLTSLTNRAPTISSDPSVSVPLGSAYSYDIVATDPDGDPLTYALANGPDGMVLSQSTVSWTPGELGTVDVAVEVSDGNGHAVRQSFTIQVTETPNQAPSFDTTPVTAATVDQAYSYAASATDPDGDTVAYALAQAPDGMSIDPATGAVQWTPTAGQVGSHPVSVSASDPDGLTATQSYTVVVSEAPNAAPSITSTPSISATEGQAYTYDVQATDSDGDTLSYTLDQAPAGMSIDGAAGLIQWTPTADQAGTVSVVVRVTDGAGGAATQSFDVTVAALPNAAPVITSSPATSATVGQPYSYTIVAEDADGDPVTFSIPTGPNGMALGMESGTITWTPGADQVGVHGVSVRATDGEDFDEQSFSISVAEPGPFDVEVSATPTSVAPGETVQITVTTSGGAPVASTSLTVNGASLSVDGSGQASFTPDAPGVYEILAAAQDSAGAEDSDQLTLAVSDPNDNVPPSVSITAPANADTLLQPTEILGSVTDDNLLRYQLLISPAGKNQYVELYSSDSQVVEDVLATLDTTTLKNGLYDLAVLAEDINGQTSSALLDVYIEGGAKPGVVQLSFTDMVVPVAGIPIRIERLYDSRVKTGDDLGVGWSLDIRQGSYINNRPPGEGWTVQASGGLISQPCAVPVEQAYHSTEVRLSDREYYRFRVQVNMSGFGSAVSGGCLGSAEFVQIDGPPGATLESISNDNVFYQSGTTHVTYDLGDPRFGDPWVPEDVRLTTPDGRVINFDLDFGITRMAQPDGDALSISRSGITASNGTGVTFERDGEGRITRITDPIGNEIEYDYDAEGDLVSFTNAMDETTSYDYSGEFPHHLVSITLPDNRVISSFDYHPDGRVAEACTPEGCTSAQYDLPGRTQTQVDATGRSTTFVYDERGNVLSRTDDLGNTYTFEYDENDNIERITDPEGNVTEQEWDANGNLLRVLEPHPAMAAPEDYTTTFTYDERGNLTSRTLPSGAEIRQSYDTDNNLLEVTDEVGNVLLDKEYGAEGLLQSETTPFGSMSFDYDSSGNLTAFTDDQGGTTTFTHDAAGNIETFTHDGVTATLDLDPLGRLDYADYGRGVMVDYGYDFGGQWTSVEGSVIPPMQRTLDANGKPTSIVQVDGGETAWVYDAAGRLRRETDAMDNMTEFHYDFAGRLVEIVDPEGGVTTRTLDGAGRILNVNNAAGEDTTFTYYPNGDVESRMNGVGQYWDYEYTPTSASVTDPLLRTQTVEYTPHGLVQAIVHPDGTQRSWTYLGSSPLQDASSLPTSVTDEAGRTRTYEYDEAGRLTAAENLAGGFAVYDYGDSGLETMTDAEGESTEFAYDEFGRVEQVTFGDSSYKEIRYNSQGKPEFISLNSGRDKTYVYDSQGRVISDSRSGGPTLGFDWNPDGSLATATDQFGTTLFDYNGNGFLTEMQPNLGGRLVFERDPVGRIAEVRAEANAGGPEYVTQYAYDDAGRLARVLDPQGGETTYDYDEASRLVERTLPNGVTTWYQYDDRDQISAVIHERSDGTVLASLTYERLPGGEPERITRADGSYVDLTYDDGVRVESETYYTSEPDYEQSIDYGYDFVGNRMSRTVDGETRTYAYGPGHRLTGSTAPSGDETYGYDLDGRITEIVRDGTSRTLEYTFDGQLSAITTTAGAIDYSYDAQGRRILADGPDGIRRFVAGPQGGEGLTVPYLIVDESDDLLQGYVFAGGQPLKRFGGGDERYYLTDAQGSVIAITDSSGNVTQRFRYDGFGRLRDVPDDQGVPAGVGGDFRFHGQWLEAATGLYHLRARDYDPETGRFLSPDTTRPDLYEVESLQRYQYANGNPYVYTDPSGRFTMVSLSLGMNLNSTLRTIAVNTLKDYAIDKARSVVGSIVTTVLKNQTSLAGFPHPFSGSVPPWEAGRQFESSVRDFLCDEVLPGRAQEILWFEPSITRSGRATANGLSCTSGSNLRAGGSTPRPDFVLSRTPPEELEERNLKSYLVGEVKLGVGTFYRSYVRPGRQRTQRDAIVNFAQRRVYSRTGVLLAFFGGDRRQERGLEAALRGDMARDGVIILLLSAMDSRR